MHGDVPCIIACKFQVEIVFGENTYRISRNERALKSLKKQQLSLTGDNINKQIFHCVERASG